MTMLINPAGGIAGDMFVAALISSGADPVHMKTAMLSAARKLGSADLNIKKAPDGSIQLVMKLRPQKHHLSEYEAQSSLNELYWEAGIAKKYRSFGNQILKILLEAEKKAHSEHNITISPPRSRHNHPHEHPHHHPTGTFLHEAQDIIIDIMGTVTGLQTLATEPRAMLLNPVSVGGGTIDFSHGLFKVPAPATKIILDSHGIPWNRGPIDKELCTPTGAAIMAALGVKLNPSKVRSPNQFHRKGKSRGSYLFDIPAFEIFID